MSDHTCPLCGQSLPPALKPDDLRRKLSDLAEPYVADQNAILQESRERERLRHQAEMAALQGKLEQLTRKLEKQTADQLGREGEINLYQSLATEFPTDDFERPGRGARGADIIQNVIQNGEFIGRIVFENKNVSDWKSEYIAQAKKYQVQYKTHYVLLVSTVLPRKQRGMCVHDEVLVVEPQFACAVARIMREGAVAVANLRASLQDSEQKSREVMEYILGDEFQVRFRDMLDAVDDLQTQQDRDRTWHENSWQKQQKSLSRIQSAHRVIAVQLSGVLKNSEETSRDGRKRSLPVESVDEPQSPRWWHRLRS